MPKQRLEANAQQGRFACYLGAGYGHPVGRRRDVAGIMRAPAGPWP
jgi:hypothetical protein